MTPWVVLLYVPVGATVQGARCGGAAGLGASLPHICDGQGAEHVVAANGTPEQGVKACGFGSRDRDGLLGVV